MFGLIWKILNANAGGKSQKQLDKEWAEWEKEQEEWDREEARLDREHKEWMRNNRNKES